MVGWLSDRVLSLLKRNLTDKSNNIHRNNLFFFFHWEGPCPSGSTYFKGYCYLVSNSIKTWHQAQAYCKRLGEDLVKINSEEQNEFVLKLVNSMLRHCVRFGWHWSGTRKEKRLSGLTTQFRHSRNGLQVNRMEMLINHAAIFGLGKIPLE